VTAPFSLIYVPRTLIVRGNATATANNIRASEMLFLTGIVVDLISLVAFLFVAMALYRLLSGVNKNHASLMVILALVSVPIGFLNVLNEIAALTLFRGADFLSVFDKRQLDALAMLFLRVHSQGIVVNEIFGGSLAFPLRSAGDAIGLPSADPGCIADRELFCLSGRQSYVATPANLRECCEPICDYPGDRGIVDHAVASDQGRQG
jgi:hypothetical protein